MEMKSAFVAAIALGCPMSAFCQEKPKPMRVYLLAGQSNMTGMARTRTLKHIKMSPDSAENFAGLFDKDGKPVTLDEVYVSQWMDNESGRLEPKYGAGKGGGFGPEYAFGFHMHRKLQEPFLIIKTSLGGSSLSYRHRSPSADKWTPPPGHPDLIKTETQEAIEAEKQKGFCYRDMITHVKMVLGGVKKRHPAYDPKAGYELAGFVWFQGGNDMINGSTCPNRDKPRGYEQYTWLLEHLIRDVRKDPNAPNMPAVIGVMGIGGVRTEGIMGHFQQAQTAVADQPEFEGNVIAVHDHLSRRIQSNLRHLPRRRVPGNLLGELGVFHAA